MKCFGRKFKICKLYCRPPGFAVMPMGRYLAGGLQSGSAANLIGVQYILIFPKVMICVDGRCLEFHMKKKNTFHF